MFLSLARLLGWSTCSLNTEAQVQVLSLVGHINELLESAPSPPPPQPSAGAFQFPDLE